MVGSLKTSRAGLSRRPTHGAARNTKATRAPTSGATTVDPAAPPSQPAPPGPPGAGERGWYSPSRSRASARPRVVSTFVILKTPGVGGADKTAPRVVLERTAPRSSSAGSSNVPIRPGSSESNELSVRGARATPFTSMIVVARTRVGTGSRTAAEDVAATGTAPEPAGPEGLDPLGPAETTTDTRSSPPVQASTRTPSPVTVPPALTPGAVTVVEVPLDSTETPAPAPPAGVVAVTVPPADGEPEPVPEEMFACPEATGELADAPPPVPDEPVETLTWAVAGAAGAEAETVAEVVGGRGGEDGEEGRVLALACVDAAGVLAAAAAELELGVATEAPAVALTPAADAPTRADAPFEPAVAVTDAVGVLTGGGLGRPPVASAPAAKASEVATARAAVTDRRTNGRAMIVISVLRARHPNEVRESICPRSKLVKHAP